MKVFLEYVHLAVVGLTVPALFATFRVGTVHLNTQQTVPPTAVSVAALP